MRDIPSLYHKFYFIVSKILYQDYRDPRTLTPVVTYDELVKEDNLPDNELIYHLIDVYGVGPSKMCSKLLPDLLKVFVEHNKIVISRMMEVNGTKTQGEFIDNLSDLLTTIFFAQVLSYTARTAKNRDRTST